MKFKQALMIFQNELAKEYGVINAVVKIGIEPRLMDQVVSDLFRNDRYGMSHKFTLSQFGEFELCGVKIVPRQRSKEF